MANRTTNQEVFHRTLIRLTSTPAQVFTAAATIDHPREDVFGAQC